MRAHRNTTKKQHTSYRNTNEFHFYFYLYLCIFVHSFYTETYMNSLCVFKRPKKHLMREKQLLVLLCNNCLRLWNPVIVPQSSFYCQQCNNPVFGHKKNNSSVGSQFLVVKSFRFRFYVNVITLDKSDWHKIDLTFTSFPNRTHNAQNKGTQKWKRTEMKHSTQSPKTQNTINNHKKANGIRS